MVPAPVQLLNVEFSLRWRDTNAAYRERRFIPNVDPERDRIGGYSLTLLADAPIDQIVSIGESHWATATGTSLRLTVSRAAWPDSLAGQRIEPRAGRWYPRQLFAGQSGITAGDRTPMQLVSVIDDAIEFDLTPPLASIPFALDATVRGRHIGSVSESREFLPQLTGNGPGMQSILAGAPTHVLEELDLTRTDESADTLFYAQPRFVDHLDSIALDQLQNLHSRFLSPAMQVLDLMASGNSHLPAEPTTDSAPINITGLGMNAAELAGNPRLSSRIVQDINRCPALPFADASFDLALCALSVEYLVRPGDIFREVARVLKPGGKFVVTVSERWFPPKAIRCWAELHPFERMGLVLSHFRHSGQFVDLHAESLRGLPRPRDDKYFRMTPLSDPLYAMWGSAPKSRR